jgi:hypothetical protein
VTKEHQIVGACEIRSIYTVLNGRDLLEELGVDGDRLILKNSGVRTGFSWFRVVSGGGIL